MFETERGGGRERERGVADRHTGTEAIKPTSNNQLLKCLQIQVPQLLCGISEVKS
jgi:hypothetical protein